MKNIFVYTSLILLVLGLMLSSCEDENYISDENAHLTFSVDTLMFDTIFTTIGSTTQSFRVINPHNQPILVSSIELAGGDESFYRLNIDGELTNKITDVEIPANDSIYIFVELTVDPNGYNQPMIVQDSISFVTNTKLQDIDLLAWGQDFIPIKQEIITSTTWTSDKPYLVYDYAYVDSGQVLTIEPGARIYFHNKAGLYVKGNIKALGTTAEPIEFSGDRLEEMYSDIPDQWQGILLFPNDELNEFENVHIKNANIGLQVGTIENEGYAYARIHNTRIEHMAFAGIFALKSQIEATNTLVADCGYTCVALLVGGSYNFTHCTVANYWGTFSNRKEAAVLISNQLVVQQEGGNVVYIGDLHNANWRNSIIWGNKANEFDFAKNEDVIFNCQLENSIVRLADTTDISDPMMYVNIIKDEDPLFFDRGTYDYQLDTLSPAKDAGTIKYGELIPFDLNGVSRLEDEAPDLGAFERIEIVENDEE